MEEQLNDLAKRYGKEIRNLLITNGLNDNNIDINFRIGKYTILYGRNRNKGQVFEPLAKLPEEFFVILSCFADMELLWHEHEQDGVFGEYETVEYYFECIVDDSIDLTGTIDELKARLLNLDKEIKDNALKENYEEAARLKEIYDNIKMKLSIMD